MRTLVKSAIAAGIAAGCMSSGAQAADYEQEIGLIVAGAVENWNGISFIDGGSTGSDTTIVSGHSGRVSLPLGPNLSLQSDIDVEWNSRAFAGDDNSAAGNIWNFQGGAHLSWRDPSRSLFGIFAAAGEERHNDTDPDINYDFTVIGGEAQFYIDNTTLYIQGAYFDVDGDLESGFFARGVGRHFLDQDTRLQLEALFANVEFEGDAGDYNVFQWGARFDTVWHNAPIVGSLPLFIGYRGTLRDGCLPSLADSDTTDHIIMAGFNYYFGANSRLDNDRRGATLDMPNVGNLLPCYDG
jgi:hypothetical protein